MNFFLKFSPPPSLISDQTKFLVPKDAQAHTKTIIRFFLITKFSSQVSGIPRDYSEQDSETLTSDNCSFLGDSIQKLPKPWGWGRGKGCGEKSSQEPGSLGGRSPRHE